ncbi:MAG: hypothetical protein PF481_06660 [Bacteroidales bacterium]|jgi:hypothetical protein|nr:hypothetical protein [Bacteroidales bacterium]
MPRKKRHTIPRFNIIILGIIGLIVIMYSIFKTTNIDPVLSLTYQRIEKLYEEDIEREAKKYDVPEEYFKALILLESSGHKHIPKRFEPHVYAQLKKVQAGRRKHYEQITGKTLKNLSDAAIRNLASSWGPFQIMGYKCYQLGIYISDLRGKESIKWGMQWIDTNYGDLLRQGRYKDAFHMHNTGRLYPKKGVPHTHNPEYVKNGLMHMKEFKKRKMKK